MGDLPLPLFQHLGRAPLALRQGFAELDPMPGTPQGTQTIRMAGAPESKPGGSAGVGKPMRGTPGSVERSWKAQWEVTPSRGLRDEKGMGWGLQRGLAFEHRGGPVA